MLTYQEIIDKIDQLEEANILVAALEFEIFSILEQHWMTAAAVARKAHIHPEGTTPLLNALVSMGALRKKENRYHNTTETYRHFCKTSPDFKKGMVMLRNANREEWARLTDIIRHGRNPAEYEKGDDPEFRRLFTHAMHERSEGKAARVAEVVARKPVGSLIDLGGGPGSYSAAILRRDKKATAVLLDRSSAINVARELLGLTKVYDRFVFLEGDLFNTDFGRGYDTVLFSNILHIYNIKQNKLLFRKIHRCLKKGGRLVLVDLFLKDNETEPYNAALFALTMLLYTATGKSYTFSETEKMLKQTGFSKIRRFELEEGSSIMEAEKK